MKVMYFICFLMFVFSGTLLTITKWEHRKLYPVQTRELVRIFDTVTVYDTVVYQDTVNTQVVENAPWMVEDVILLVKYTKTQQDDFSADNWCVLQVMVNRCRRHDITMREYYANPNYNHSQTIQRIERGEGYYPKHSFDWDEPNDIRMYHRAIAVITGHIPDSVRISPDVLYFESHEDTCWNAGRTSGVFQRKDISCTFVHEFYYHPKTLIQNRKFPYGTESKKTLTQFITEGPNNKILSRPTLRSEIAGNSSSSGTN